jgi:hypothetical protein
VMERGYGENTVADVIGDRQLVAAILLYVGLAGCLLWFGETPR